MGPRPETRFADSAGVSIAYQVVGDRPVDLVFVPGFMSHVELNWDYPFYAMLLEDFASYARLVVMDKRGTGLSDRTAGLATFEERMDDVRAVMDAADLDAAHLVGISEGAAAVALFAATHPDRVQSLSLMGAACPGVFDLSDRAQATMLAFIRDGWRSGRVLDFFVQNRPDDDASLAALGRLEQYCCEPDIAVEIMRRILESDVRDVVSTVTARTLVLHNRHDPVARLEHGEHYARAIAGAELQVFDGDFHGTWQPGGYREFLAAIRRFVTGDAAVAPGPAQRVLSTVLFTDIADSTVRAAELGDARWRELLDGHDRAATEEVAHHGGVLVKSTGDGILARFDGPSRAVACAHALRRRAEGLGLQTRAGAHTGEIELRGDDVGGIAVHIASRVAGLAGAGEVLVSRTVKDLSVGSDLTFEDRGEQALKGVPEPWRVYAAA